MGMLQSASCEVFVSLLCLPWVFGVGKVLIILPSSS